MIDHSLLGQIAKDLQSLALGVSQAEIESTHQVSLPIATVRGSYPQAALNKLDNWVREGAAGSRYIYQFFVPEAVPSLVLYEAFSQAKASKLGGRAYARLHKPSQLLYVGSSGSLMTRIKQHFGYGPKGTYAMQLGHWLPDVDGDLHIQAWRFAEGAPKAVIQAIEDGLWVKQNPMFGRKGAL